MRRIIPAVGAAAFLVTAVSLSLRADRAEPKSDRLTVQARVEARNPWSHLKVNNDPDEFQFAIVTDRTGGLRPGVFERAVEVLNLLQPEFVISVGDLIPGTVDAKATQRQWAEFNGLIQQLEMPFFYLPGNHDVGTAASSKLWNEQFGRRYFHFVYRDVLFLMLDSEETPRKASGLISADQIKFVEQTLNQNRDARWTIVAVHKPLWSNTDVAQTGWLEVEKLLHGRRHTVFAGHKHRYEKFQRNGADYYMLATTGGSSKLRGLPFGEFDHLVWVTQKKCGPRLANVMLDGIHPENIDTNVGAIPAPKATKGEGK